ncbi:MAG: FAD:protein FMN transferase [Candidatus Dojkabacteria bacterium]|nr:MAG: FAD:protein FMN transferase [Candidatus Dojkabacteria bacterium]
MRNLIEQQKNFMNTIITIKVVQIDQHTVQILDTIEEAFYEFDRVVKKFTRFNEDSELTNLNRQAGDWVKVSREFFDLIKFMLEMFKQTSGFFDPTIIDFLETYGYDPNYNFSKLENPNLPKEILNIAKKRPSFNEISLDEKNLKVKLKPKQRIDLGAIGKGWAMDLASQKIKKVSGDFLIDAGGDVIAYGKNALSKPWNVTLKSKNREIGTINLQNQAIASSGNWARKVKFFHHLINPFTGQPVETNYDTVFVVAQTSLVADAWATALFVGGPKTKCPDDIFVKFT